MAEFIIKCPQCNCELKAEDQWIGMEVECPACHKKFMIQQPAVSEKNTQDMPAGTDEDFAEPVSGGKKKKWIIPAAIGGGCLFLALLAVLFCASYFNLDVTTARKIKSLKQKHPEILHTYIEKKVRECKTRSEVDAYQIPEDLVRIVQESRSNNVDAGIKYYNALLDPNRLNNPGLAEKTLHSLAERNEEKAIRILLDSVTAKKNTPADNEILKKLAAQNNRIVIKYFMERKIYDDLAFHIMQNAAKTGDNGIWEYLYQTGIREGKTEFIDLCCQSLNPDKNGEKALALSDYFLNIAKDQEKYEQYLRSSTAQRNKIGARRYGTYLLSSPSFYKRRKGVSVLKTNREDPVSLYVLGKYWLTSKNPLEKKQGNAYYQQGIQKIEQDFSLTQDPEIKFYYAVICLYPNDGRKPQERRALEILTALAEQSDVNAMKMLAHLYRAGYLSIPKSEEKYLAYVKRLADKGLSDYQYIYGGHLVSKDKYPEAFFYFSKGAAAQNASCIRSLGFLYQTGMGCQKNLQKARSCFQEAAERKDEIAALEYAKMLIAGEGGQKDCKQAEAILKRLLEKKINVSAAEQLAEMYLAVPDEKNAIRYYQLAAQAGSERSKKMIADYYAKVSKNFIQDKASAQEAWNSGHAEKAESMMEKYKDVDVPEICRYFADYNCKLKKYEEVRKYCAKLVSMKDAAGIRKMGILLFKGLGGKSNEQEAFRLFSQGASLKDTESMNYLAFMTAMGLGTPKDLKKAAALFNLAAKSGSENARMNLGMISSAGSGVLTNFDLAISYYSMSIGESAEAAKRQIQYLREIKKLSQEWEKEIYNIEYNKFLGRYNMIPRRYSKDLKAVKTSAKTVKHYYLADVDMASWVYETKEPLVTVDGIVFYTKVRNFSKLEAAIKEYRRTHPEMIEESCPSCLGSGQIQVMVSSANPSGGTQTCQRCRGTGKIYVSKGSGQLRSRRRKK